MVVVMIRIVVCIELPSELGSGQVRWHMPEWRGVYDGHSTPEKYERIRTFVRMMEAGRDLDDDEPDTDGVIQDVRDHCDDDRYDGQLDSTNKEIGNV